MNNSEESKAREPETPQERANRFANNSLTIGMFNIFVFGCSIVNGGNLFPIGLMWLCLHVAGVIYVFLALLGRAWLGLLALALHAIPWLFFLYLLSQGWYFYRSLD